MIQLVTDHIVERLSTITIAPGVAIKIYEPGAARPQGETEYPHLDLGLINWQWDDGAARPQEELFIPYTQQATVTVDKAIGTEMRALLVGIVAGPYTIETGMNDILEIRSGYQDEWEEPETITLPAGELSARTVVHEINYQIQSFHPLFQALRYNASYIAIETIKPGWDLELICNEHGAYAELGLPTGVRSHLDRSGPIGYTVERYPQPIQILYQLDIRASEMGRRDALIPAIIDRIPFGYQPEINGYHTLFAPLEPQTLDELEHPLFRTAFRWWVTGVWIDPLTGDYEIGSLTQPTLDIDAE